MKYFSLVVFAAVISAIIFYYIRSRQRDAREKLSQDEALKSAGNQSVSQVRSEVAGAPAAPVSAHEAAPVVAAEPKPAETAELSEKVAVGQVVSEAVFADSASESVAPQEYVNVVEESIAVAPAAVTTAVAVESAVSVAAPVVSQGSAAASGVVADRTHDVPVTVPEDSVLRRHFLSHVQNQLLAGAPDRPTDSVLSRHYDQWLAAQLDSCVNDAGKLKALLAG
jgi:hypothetical protein